MKKLLPLLSCLLLTGCGEKKVTGENRDTGTGLASKEPTVPNENADTSVDSATVESSANEVADLSPLPETVTKEFIMGLWAKPHDGRNIIEELADEHIRAGVWKVVTGMGPDKGEVADTTEASMIVKMVDRRFQVWQWSVGQHVEYSFVSYDYDAKRYRWWGVQPDGFITEWSGRRYWRNLMEWETVKVPEEDVQVTIREVFVSEDRKRLKMAGEIKRDNEVVAYRKDEFTWLSELSEEHGIPEAK